MSISIAISIDAREVQARLAATRGALGASAAIHRVAAESVGKLVRGWLLARNQQRSRHASSNYWARAAEATLAESDARSGRVIVRHPGIRWHRYGGRIEAKPGKALALPLRDDVYGIWPSERFPNRGDAFVWRGPRGKAYLAARDGKALRIYYALVKSVSKRADPSVLPSDASMHSAATSAVRSLLALSLSRRGPS